MKYKMSGARQSISPSRKIIFSIALYSFAISSSQSRAHAQREFNPVEAYTSDSSSGSGKTSSSSLFVQQLLDPPGHHSSLFYTPALTKHRRQDLDGDPSSIYTTTTTTTNNNNNNNNHHHNHNNRHNNDHYDETELPGAAENYPHEDHEDRLNHQNYANGEPTTTNYTDGTPPAISAEQAENNSPDRILLTHEFIERTCQLDRGSQRNDQLNNTYLTYCFRYKLENLLSNEILMSIMHHDSGDCEKILDEFIQLDETINQFDSLFIKLLSRYNCHNGYSVKWNCDDCKKAYKDWLCATHLPFYMNGERIKPCISFCERVEQRCPYLHPITREQYGGQPVFICRDPNIPFVPDITPDIPYSKPGKCYDLCHLSDNLTELITDSLSKYDYDKCPDRSSIAGEVRSESTAITNDSRFPGSSLSAQDALDYSEINDHDDDEEANTNVLANRTDSKGKTKVLLSHSEHKKVHVHNKKLEELRDVLAKYKNQAKTHRYHADHSSIEHYRPQSDLHQADASALVEVTS